MTICLPSPGRPPRLGLHQESFCRLSGCHLPPPAQQFDEKRDHNEGVISISSRQANALLFTWYNRPHLGQIDQIDQIDHHTDHTDPNLP